MEKYGFVYIWFDRKWKRYYIGCHWGTEDDGYICSSSWMNLSYKKRPQDFKRRIITRIYTTRKDLLETEYKWLQLIPESELGSGYYNLKQHHYGHWTATDNKKTITEKMANSLKMRVSKMSDDERKQIFGGHNAGRKSSRKGLTLEQEYGIEKANEIRNKIKYKRSLQINNNSETLKKKSLIPWNKGKTGIYSEETRKKMGWSKGKKLNRIPKIEKSFINER